MNTQPLTQAAIDAYRALTEDPHAHVVVQDKPVKRRTLADAVRAAQARAQEPSRTFSVFLTENLTRYRSGRRIAKVGIARHNLTTDTAVGYTNRRDWQSKAMGQGCSMAFATITGNLTSVSATVATNSGAAFPTAGQGLAGSIIVVSRNSSGTGTTVYGRISSNTATACTVDQWYDATSTSGAAATTPNGTGAYIILPGQAPAEWMAVTSDVTAPTSAETTLISEATTNGFARAVGTYSHTAAATTFLLSHLFTASGSLTVNNEAIFGACNTTGGGVLPYKSAEPTPPALLSGDTLTQNVTITIN